MPSLRSAAIGAAAVLAGVSSADIFSRGSAESCPLTSSSPLSCHNTTTQSNLCCFNAPGGALLQTQFWDTNPSTGPSNSFTVHGLWPDLCSNGGYQSNCDANRAYTNISAILTNFGRQDLLSYAQTYWKNSPSSGTDESLWEHEWEKHGTCISTLDTDCYTNYQSTQEVVDFFNTTISLFKQLPTYTWLSNAGITPSSSTTYTSSAINAALKQQHSQDVTINCVNGAIDEVYYTFNVRGNIQTGQFVPAAPATLGNCPSSGIQYLPKSGSGGGSGTTTSTPPGSTPTGGGSSFSGSGHVNVVDSSGNQNGCLISNGKWYTTGTCATYQVSNGQMKTSKGACQVSGNALNCASGNSASTFTADSNGVVSYQGSSAFSAAQEASGSDQETVSTGSGSVGLQLVFQSS